MKPIGSIERWLMGTKWRRKVQVRETLELKAHSQLSSYGKALEVGCGNGYGQELIKQSFKPEEYTGIDLDKKSIAKALQKGVGTGNVRFQEADITNLPFEDSSYDSVFNFGCIHHVPDWKKAFEEIYRVMKPGAEFLSIDFDKKFFKRWDPLKKWSMPHPYKTMYTQEEFKSHLEFLGMVVTFHNPDFSPAAKMNYFVIIAKK